MRNRGEEKTASFGKATVSIMSKTCQNWLQGNHKRIQESPSPPKMTGRFGSDYAAADEEDNDTMSLHRREL